MMDDVKIAKKHYFAHIIHFTPTEGLKQSKNILFCVFLPYLMAICVNNVKKSTFKEFQQNFVSFFRLHSTK